MSRKNTIRYRLIGSKKPKSFQVPIRGVMMPKPVGPKGEKVLKAIAYVPGTESIFVEDHKGDQKSKSVWLEDGLLDVSIYDSPLLQIMDQHPWAGVKWERDDPEKDAQAKLSKNQKIKKALDHIDINDPDKLLATAMSLVDSVNITTPPSIVQAELEELAFNDPDAILKEIGSPIHQAKLIGILALMKGAIKYNIGRTAILWPNGQKIISVPPGVDALHRFGEFLSGDSDDAKVTMQTLGEQVTDSYKIKGREVKKMIEEQLPDPEGDQQADAADPEYSTPSIDDMDHDRLLAAYEAAFGKPGHNPKKKDTDWIRGKLKDLQTDPA